MKYKHFFINLTNNEASKIYNSLTNKEKFVVDKIYNEYQKENINDLSM